MGKPAASYFHELEMMGVDVTRLKGKLTDSELEALTNNLQRLLRRKHVAPVHTEAD